MKITLPTRAPGEEGSLVVLEVEFTTKARRLRVVASEGLEALDLRAEAPGGTYELSPALPRVHVPLRVTRGGAGDGRVVVTLEDAAGGAEPERWEGSVHLDAPARGLSRAAVLGLLAAFALVAAGLVAFVIVPTLRDPRVPDLSGRTRAQAESALKSLGFAVVTESVDAKAPKDVGTVVSQAPAAGSSVPRGGSIVLTVGRAPDTTPLAVPSLVGRTPAEAEALLAGTGFRLEPVPEDAADELEGRIVRQSPEPGARRAAGAAVRVAIGRRRPKPLVDVPDLSGLSRAEAEARLTERGLRPVPSEEDAADDRVGLVVRQSPAASARVEAGAEVALGVGRAVPPPPVREIPHVLGLPRAAAEKALADAGFVSTVLDAERRTGAPGTVVAQDPVGGAARQGTRVTLEVVPIAAPAGTADPTPAAGSTPPAPTSSPATPAAPAPAVEPTPSPEPAPPVARPPDPPNAPASSSEAPVPPGVAPPATPDPGPAPEAAPTVEPAPEAATPVAPPSVAPPVAPSSGPRAPDLLGMNRLRAEGELRQAGLQHRVVYEEVSADLPEGVVLRQSPSAGSAVPEGTVEIVVARRPGPRRVAVPDVVGRPEADAAGVLRAQTFLVHVMTETGPTAMEGKVLRQTPAAGAEEGERTWVTIYVGRVGPAPGPAPRAAPAPPPPPAAPAAPAGVPPASTEAPAPAASPPRPEPQLLTVPAFEGRDAFEAVETAIRTGLVPRVVVATEAGPSGRIRRQDPVAGSPSRTGSPVTLTIGPGEGGAPTDVPDVVGLTPSAAAARLSAAGLRAYVLRVTAPAGVFPDPERIVAQTPVGRVVVDRNAPVRLFLAR